MGLARWVANSGLACVVAGGIGAIAGCSSNSAVINNPTAPVTPLTLTDVFVVQGAQATKTAAITGTGVLQYKATAPGNAVPVTSNYLGTANVRSVATDAQGNLYIGAIANGLAEIVIMPPPYLPNAPVKTILGYNLNGAVASPCQTFQDPYQIQVGAGGAIYVLDDVCEGVFAFSTLDSGQVTPAQAIVGAATLINNPVAMAADSAGNIYVANHFGAYAGDPAPDGAQVLVFGPGSNGGAPLKTITGTTANPLSPILGITLDSSANVWVNFGPKIVEYLASSKGDYTQATVIVPPASEVQSTAMQFDVSGNMWVLWLDQTLIPHMAVYPKTATGFSTPQVPYNTQLWTLTPLNGQFALLQ